MLKLLKFLVQHVISKRHFCRTVTYTLINRKVNNWYRKENVTLLGKINNLVFIEIYTAFGKSSYSCFAWTCVWIGFLRLTSTFVNLFITVWSDLISPWKFPINKNVIKKVMGRITRKSKYGLSNIHQIPDSKGILTVNLPKIYTKPL